MKGLARPLRSTPSSPACKGVPASGPANARHRTEICDGHQVLSLFRHEHRTSPMSSSAKAEDPVLRSGFWVRRGEFLNAVSTGSPAFAGDDTLGNASRLS